MLPPPWALLREHDLTSASDSSLLLWKYVPSISKMTCAWGRLPNAAARPLMTRPIVFHLKAIQLESISPLSDYQWPIDRGRTP